MRRALQIFVLVVLGAGAAYADTPSVRFVCDIKARCDNALPRSICHREAATILGKWILHVTPVDVDAQGRGLYRLDNGYKPHVAVGGGPGGPFFWQNGILQDTFIPQRDSSALLHRVDVRRAEAGQEPSVFQFPLICEVSAK